MCEILQDLQANPHKCFILRLVLPYFQKRDKIGPLWRDFLLEK